MVGLIAAWAAAKRGWSAVRANWRVGAGAVVGAALMLPLAYCAGGSAMKDRIEAKAKVEAAEQAAANEKAKAASAEQALKDTATVSAAQKGRDDAIRAGEDAPPSGPGLRAACQRLCVQPETRNRLPPECRPFGPCEAPAQR